MLYVFTGDRFRSIKKIQEIVSVCRKKQPDSEYIIFSSEHQDRNLKELLYSNPLFHQKKIIFCDEVSAIPALFDEVIKNLDRCCPSEDLFIVYEPSLSSDILKKLKKIKAPCFHFEIKKEQDSSAFIFLDVFSERNTLSTFLLFHKLILKGEDANKLINLLRWQLKTLLLVKFSKNIAETDLKPFPYNQAIKKLKKLEGVDLGELLLKLEEYIHTGRLKQREEKDILERFILTYA